MKPKPASKKLSARLDHVMADPFIKKFIKFYGIELKSDKEVENLPPKKRRQYMCRFKRWDRLVTTHVDLEVYKSIEMFRFLDEAILETDRKLREVTTDPDFEMKDDEFKKKVEKDQFQLNEVVKQVKSDRSNFDQIFKEYKEMKEDDRERQIKEMEEDQEMEELDQMEKLKIKQEVLEELENDIAAADAESDSDVEYKEEIEIKEEYISEDSEGEDSKKKVEEDIKKGIKAEIKGEMDVKPKIKREIKPEIKREIKPEIKSEVKPEVKVKEEVITSDEEEDDE